MSDKKNEQDKSDADTATRRQQESQNPGQTAPGKPAGEQQRAPGAPSLQKK